MTLEEYKQLKKESEHSIEHEETFKKDVVVVKDGVEFTIKLGALEKFLEDGYLTKNANF